MYTSNVAELVHCQAEAAGLQRSRVELTGERQFHVLTLARHPCAWNQMEPLARSQVLCDGSSVGKKTRELALLFSPWLAVGAYAPLLAAAPTSDKIKDDFLGIPTKTVLKTR